jgi:hypothetical protein
MSQLFCDLPVMLAPSRPAAPPRPRPSRAKVKTMPTFGAIVTDPDEHRAQLARKPRRCLSCGDTFPSEHAGNRICSGCKQLVAWGTPNDFSLAITASF